MVWPVHCRGTVGVVKNPNGRPSSLFQGFSDRSALLLEKYGRSEILAIADDDKRLDEFSSFDCLLSGSWHLRCVQTMIRRLCSWMSESGYMIEQWARRYRALS